MMGLIEKNWKLRWERPRFSEAPCQRVSGSPRPTSRGYALSCAAAFTLLELMIVITIVIILRLLLCRSTNVRFWRHEKQFCEKIFSVCAS